MNHITDGTLLAIDVYNPTNYEISSSKKKKVTRIGLVQKIKDKFYVSLEIPYSDHYRISIHSLDDILNNENFFNIRPIKI